MQCPIDYAGGDIIFTGFNRLINSTSVTDVIEADTATGTLDQPYIKRCHITLGPRTAYPNQTLAFLSLL